MIAATCTLIGLAAGMTRSVLSISMAAILIGITFLVAVGISVASLPLTALLLAIFGYNLGLIGYLSLGILLASRSSAYVR